jgi:hypothetical protein
METISRKPTPSGVGGIEVWVVRLFQMVGIAVVWIDAAPSFTASRFALKPIFSLPSSVIVRGSATNKNFVPLAEFNARPSPVHPQADPDARSLVWSAPRQHHSTRRAGSTQEATRIIVVAQPRNEGVITHGDTPAIIDLRSGYVCRSARHAIKEVWKHDC